MDDRIQQMGVIEICTVIQRAALKNDRTAFLADDGRGKWPNGRQIRMVMGSGKRHAVDVLRVLLDLSHRNRQFRHLRMIEQSAVHVYAKMVRGQPSFEK